MSSESTRTPGIPPRQSNSFFWYLVPSGRALTTLTTLCVIAISTAYVLVPRLIRKYASGFKIGNVGFLSINDVEWGGHRVWVKGKGMVMKSELKSKLEEIGIGERTKVRLGCLGLRFGKREGVRRQWVALRVSDVRIRIPKAHLESSRDAEEDAGTGQTTSGDRESDEDQNQQNSMSSFQSAHQPHSDPARDFNMLNAVKAIVQNTFNMIKSTNRYLSSQPPNSPLRFLLKCLRFFRIKVMKPTLIRLNQLGRHFSWVVSIFGFEVNNIHIEVDQICKITCSLKIGFELLRGKDSQICSWIIVKEIQLYRWTAPIGAPHAQSNRKIRPNSMFNSPRPLPESSSDLAFNLPGRVELSARAHLDPVVGLASILRPSRQDAKRRIPIDQSHNNRLDERVTHDKTYGHLVRPHSIDFHITFFEPANSNMRSKRKPRSPEESQMASGILLALHNTLHIVHSLPIRKTTQPHDGQAPESRSSPTKHSSTDFLQPDLDERQSARLAPLSILRRFQVELPSITCTYLPTLSATESPESPSMASQPTYLATSSPLQSPPFTKPKVIPPSNVSARLTLQGLALNLDLSEDQMDWQKPRGTHMEWFGRGNPVLLRFHARWKEVALSAELFPSGTIPSPNLPLESTFHDPQLYQKVRVPNFHISETYCTLSSTWLPKLLRKQLPTKQKRLASTSYINFMGDHNAHMLVAEIEIGSIKSQMSIDDLTLVNVLDLNLSSRQPYSRKVSEHAQPDASSMNASNGINHNRFFSNVPRLATIVSLHSFSFDLYGPSIPGPLAFGPGSANDLSDSISNVWTSSDILTMGCSALHLTIIGEYVDLCLKRTEAQKREARKRAKTNEVFIPASLRDVNISQGHADAITGDRHFTDPEGTFDNQEEHAHRGNTHATAERVMSSLKNETGLYTQAYPLPIPKATAPSWQSRVEIFREADEIDFLYQCTTTFITSSVDVIFSSNTPHEDHHLRHNSIDLHHLDHSRVPISRSNHELLCVTSIEMVGDVSVAGWDDLLQPDLCPIIDLASREGTLQVVIDDVDIDIWRPNVMSSLAYISQMMSSLKASRAPAASIAPRIPPPRTQLFPLDIACSLAIVTMSVRTASFDSKCDPKIARGTRIQTKAFLVEFFRQSSARPGLYSFPNRIRLDLREDIRLQSNSKLVHNSEFDTCLVKCDIGSVKVVCVPDVTEALSMSFDRPATLNQERYQSQSLWELKGRLPLSKRSLRTSPANLNADPDGEDPVNEESDDDILFSERLACRVTLQTLKKPIGAGQDELIAAMDAQLIKLRVDTFHIYCCLLSTSALIGLMKAGKLHPQKQADVKVVKSRRALQVGIRAEIQAVHLHLRLSPQVPLPIELRRLSIQRSQKLGIDIRWDTLLAAGKNAANPLMWDDILKIKTCKIKIVETHPISPPHLAAGKINRGWHPFIVLIEGDAARLRLPFKFIIAEVIESISRMIKTIKQLSYQFIKGGYGSVLQPVVENPKRLPEIQIQFRIIVVQAEDDPFENKLNAIRRAGKEEVKERLARDESFQKKANEINMGGKSASTSANFPQKSEIPFRSDVGSLNFSEDEKFHRHSFSSSFSSPGEAIPRVSVEEAARRLQEYNAASWIKRIRNAIAEQERHEDGIQRQLYGHASHKVSNEFPVKILPLPKTSPLVRAVFNSIHIALYKAECEKVENGLMDYLHRVGKGLPRDTKFSSIVPFHLSWQMEGASVRLRDFPLYLFSLPRPQVNEGNQQQRQPDQHTWQLESDFVIAEEMCTIESVRTGPSLIVPRKYSSEGRIYSIEVPRSVMPVKSYANPVVKIRSMCPVRIGWGNSMQPAVQDMVRVLESLSKPPADPSDRLGFWDKVRLVLHWIVEINFIGSKTDVVLHLKGSRDPYELLGSGAGFAKVWRGNVKFLLGHDNSDQEFFQIKSDQYILGIPNLRDLIDTAASGSAPLLTASSAASYKRRYRQASGVSDSDDESDTDAVHARKTEFLKIVAKLTNGVRWGMGIVLERACGDEEEKTCGCTGPAFHRKCRIFKFKPHYQVVTKTLQYAITPAGERHDSFKTFRSDFIHFSISLTSPTDDKSLLRRPSGQNSLHVAPEAFTHFWSWLKTFDSALSLPIRQGALFASSQSASKKFGRHVATIKYRFSISPLFLAHTYKYEDSADWVNGQSVVLGLKAKISSFKLDMHTRAIETTIRTPEMKQPQKIIRKAFYKAEIDCQDVDIRAISAIFNVKRKAAYAADLGLEPDQDDSETNSILNDFSDNDELDVDPSDPSQQASSAARHSGRCSDKDSEWIDMDDYHDILFWPQNDLGECPKVKVLDVVSCPQISYLRRPSSAGHWTLAYTNGPNQTSDHDVSIDGQPIEKTKFGEEGTHTCLIGKAQDPMTAQIGLLDLRLHELEREREWYNTKAFAQDSVSSDTVKRREIDVRMETVRELRARMLNIKDSVAGVKDPDLNKQSSSASRLSELNMESSHWAEEEQYLSEVAEQVGDNNKAWSNRLLVHNPSILISNSTRDVLLKYYYSSSQRIGFMYHISARAVKFILELADQKPVPAKTRQEQAKRKSRIRSCDLPNFNPQSSSAYKAELHSHPQFSRENPIPMSSDFSTDEQAELDIPDDFMVDPADLVLLMRPQIAFKSEVDDISTVILTAFQVQLKSYEVLDSAYIDDPVNAKVMRRNFSTIRGFQVFYPSQTPIVSSTSGTGVGQPLAHQSLVPLEVLVDLRLEPWGFDRLIGRCTVDITYDNFNQLRIKRRSAGADSSFSTSSQPHLQSSTDLLRVEAADALSVHATALHYRAIYNVVTDLCLYTDPAQKKRNAALETMQYAYDVDDLSRMAEHIQEQQTRIRLDRTQLVEEYAHLTTLENSRMFELTQREYNLWANASDLNLMMEAIRRSQESRRGRSSKDNLAGVQLQARAKVITWHMIAGNGESIAKLSVNNTNFEWSSLPDTSVTNRLFVQELLALNISADPNRTFDEILSRYEPVSDGQFRTRSKNFLTAVWKTLPPIGGISIVESFLLDVHPIRLQIEHAIGIKIHEYLFARKLTPGDDAEASATEPGSRIDRSRKSFVSESRPPLPRTRSTSRIQPRTKRPQLGEVFSDDRRITTNTPIHSYDFGNDLATRSRGQPGEVLHLKPDWRSSPSVHGQSSSSGANSAHSTRTPSIISVSSEGRRGSSGLVSTSDKLLQWNKQKTEDAAEMKKRAGLYKSFAFIDVVPTTICVSYSGPKYPDIFDLVVKIPPFHFESRTWSYSEFFDEIRKTCVASLFKQTPSILGQIITTARKNKSVPKLMSQKVASGLKLKKRSFFDRNNHVSISSLLSSTHTDSAFPRGEHDNHQDLAPGNSSRSSDDSHASARSQLPALPQHLGSMFPSNSDERHRDTRNNLRPSIILEEATETLDPEVTNLHNPGTFHRSLPHAAKSETSLPQTSPKYSQFPSTQAAHNTGNHVSSITSTTEEGKDVGGDKSGVDRRSLSYWHFRRKSEGGLSSRTLVSRRPMASESALPMPELPAKYAS
ncbi:hypothetical protein CROQUDRAFT_109221 [Cronartium quercuum f. sp. fusiforme G11]|uniref:Uncharacterized protein n=1 Tax=Cronartium quercuum f. sp. fusiforme G11 TaxID=708437 RepID=A0A9P6NB74_9BASI|nr:hypothetical protein CROQUDRAFT_109221 [Cronartium quercuum f. sp. fusiforme G11]